MSDDDKSHNSNFLSIPKKSTFANNISILNDTDYIDEKYSEFLYDFDSLNFNIFQLDKDM